MNQFVLLQVCRNLGILCETEYFGLLYSSPNTQPLPNEIQWINLRNPLHRRNSADTLLLDLRVKFWVPGHLILQEKVRDVFHMQVREMLLNRQLRPSDWNCAAKLSALLAHSDGIEFSERSLLENSNELMETFEQSKHHSTDSDFTKQHKKHKSSRHKTASENCDTKEQNENLQRLQLLKLHDYFNYVIEPHFDATEAHDPMPQDLFSVIAKEHEKLSRKNMSQQSAKYWLLEEISFLKGFGEESFHGILVSNESSTSNRNIESVRISVSPHGIYVCQLETQTKFR